MEILSLGLHVTDTCPISCQHCAYHCGPHVKGCMSLENALHYLKTIDSAEVVSISGGEPFLYFDLLLSLVREAHALERDVWVFTNCYWATPEKNVKTLKTLKILKDLKEAGLTKIWLSADGFHQPAIPFSHVKNAISAAVGLGLDVAVDVRFIGSLKDENPVNLRTRKILEKLEKLEELEDVEVLKGQPLYIGRGSALSSYLPKKPGIPRGSCPGPWAGGTWEHPQGVDIDLYGEVTLCPGISIGNTKKCSLDILLVEYDPHTHVIIQKLLKGPRILAEKAQEMGYVPALSYINECHLCYEVRKFLRHYYPEELSPQIVYTG